MIENIVIVRLSLVIDLRYLLKFKLTHSRL